MSLKPTFHEILFANNLFHNLIILKFHTEHGHIIAMLCAKFQNDCTTKVNVMIEGDAMTHVTSLQWISNW